MWKILPCFLSTLILLLSKTLGALAVAFTNSNYDGIGSELPFDIKWTGDGTVSRSCPSSLHILDVENQNEKLQTERSCTNKAEVTGRGGGLCAIFSYMFHE